MTRVITHEEARAYAQRLLDVLGQEGIETVADLDACVGRVFARSDTPDHIQFEVRPSNGGTCAYVVSCIAPGRGIPLEVRLNAALGYAKIILKGGFLLPTYNPFCSDPFGNIIQDQTLTPADFSCVKAELARLASEKDPQAES